MISKYVWVEYSYKTKTLQNTSSYCNLLVFSVFRLGFFRLDLLWSGHDGESTCEDTLTIKSDRELGTRRVGSE